MPFPMLAIVDTEPEAPECWVQGGCVTPHPGVLELAVRWLVAGHDGLVPACSMGRSKLRDFQGPSSRLCVIGTWIFLVSSRQR